MPAWGQYKPAPDGGLDPWAIIVPEVSDGRIVELTFFLDTGRLFPLFALPDHLD
jgi:RNA polymerase sigma-70 factor (ECF subfamily)